MSQQPDQTVPPSGTNAIQCRTWDFTYFPQTQEDQTRNIIRLCEKFCKNWVFQLEDGSEIDFENKVSDHYQGRVCFRKKIRKAGIRKAFEELKGCHWGPTSGANSKKFNYVIKGNAKAGPWTDKDSEPDIHNPLVEDNVWVGNSFQDFFEKKFRDYQNSSEADKWRSRTAMWVHNTSGNTGKSFLSDRLEFKKLGMYVPPMDCEKTINFLMNFPPENGYLFDLPKAFDKKKFNTLCQTIETIKSGRLYDWRHKGKRKRIVPPAILVLSNEAPPFESLSLDRWEYYTLDKDGKIERPNIVLAKDI